MKLKIFLECGHREVPAFFAKSIAAVREDGGYFYLLAIIQKSKERGFVGLALLKSCPLASAGMVWAFARLSSRSA